MIPHPVVVVTVSSTTLKSVLVGITMPRIFCLEIVSGFATGVYRHSGMVFHSP